MSFVDSLHEATSFVSVDVLRFIPFVVLAVALLPLVLASRRPKPIQDVRFWRLDMRIGLLVAAMVFTMTSLLVFAYIVLWPHDTRWSVEPITVAVPDASAPDLSGIPVAGEALDEQIGGFVNSINQQLGTIESQTNTALGPVNTGLAYINAFSVAWVYLVYMLGGLMVMFMATFWAVISYIRRKVSSRSDREEVAEKGGYIETLIDMQQENASLQQQIGYMEQKQEQLLQIANKQAWRDQVNSVTGHDPDQADLCYAYDAALDYIGNPTVYRDFAKQQIDKREAARAKLKQEEAELKKRIEMVG